MGQKIIIVEGEAGWGIFDALSGDCINEGAGNIEESLKIAHDSGYDIPVRNKKGDFFSDMDGKPLFLTKPAKSGGLELEYADCTPFLDFELCPVCKGPAFGRAIKRKNCYYCPTCGTDIDCVPPEELIGELD